jgi:hypothetical protein
MRILSYIRISMGLQMTMDGTGLKKMNEGVF